MKIEEAVKFMSKLYLNRILSSFTKDIIPPEEEKIREYIIQVSEELARIENIQSKLSDLQPQASRILVLFVLESLINHVDCALSEHELVEAVQRREESLLETANSNTALQYADRKSLSIYKTVLEVALEDNEISTEEYRLLRRLREHLGMTLKQEWIVKAQLNAFPSPGGEVHSIPEIKEAVKLLETKGILFNCNKKSNLIVLPEELRNGVKVVLEIELGEYAKENFWKKLPVEGLRGILKKHSLPTSGAKDMLVDRILAAEILPSHGLSCLGVDDLYKICKSLPGVNVSGTKDERIARIIEYFDKLDIRVLPDNTPPGALYYEYYEALASRDRQNLLANEVISKDIDIESAFEEGTRYLFTEKLGLSLLDMPRSEHPDGLMDMGDGTLFMWDNKSKEEAYTFPNDHLRQFKRYIRDSVEKRVNCFMIVVPSIVEDAEGNCLLLKSQSQHDTDVCIITAKDLKWVAENWGKDPAKEKFNLQVFNRTGILTRKKLEQGMKVYS